MEYVNFINKFFGKLFIVLLLCVLTIQFLLYEPTIRARLNYAFSLENKSFVSYAEPEKYSFVIIRKKYDTSTKIPILLNGESLGILNDNNTIHFMYHKGDVIEMNAKDIKGSETILLNNYNFTLKPSITFIPSFLIEKVLEETL